LGRYSRLVPGFVLRYLEKTVCQDRLNELLRNNFPREGAEFCEGVLADLDVGLTVVGEDKLPSPAQRRVVFVSNHPLGGLDGMALIAWATRRYGGKVHFVVNNLLDAVAPLRSVFVPVNKHGSQSRESIRAIDEAFAGEDPVLVFPAGLCSRRGSNGVIADLEWQKMFVNKAVEHHRDVVPLYFSGRNSDFFYNFAKIRKQLGLKFNIEMIYLPSEIFRARGSRFTLVCGDTIGWQELRSGKAAMEQAAEIRSLVYSLASRLQTTTE
ncbi:MAG: 1-acyl-sn-glycerol-3-phosphate acyltransferase, partial [Muribaculaceae bacterium]|nr:1-acyl-sn-glycerol-3-phosphate acyltransferase [Muribaculaceae bacterium]